MTIDEAIAHAREKAEQNRNRALHFNTVKCIKCAEEHDQLADWLTHLKEYQQLEEQGRLLKLPCKVGDTVWDIDYGIPFACTITAFSFGECDEDTVYYAQPDGENNYSSPEELIESEFSDLVIDEEESDDDER